MKKVIAPLMVIVILCAATLGGFAFIFRDGSAAKGGEYYSAIVAEKDAKIAELEAKVEDSEEKLAGAEADKVALLVQIAALNAERSSLLSQISALNIEKTSLIGQLAAGDEKYADLIEQYLALQEKEATLLVQLQLSEERVAEIQEEFDDFRNELLSLLATVSFAEDSWTLIGSIAASNLAPLVYSVGDTKDFIFAEGVYFEEVLTVVILGFNHDDLADGSGKAGITLGLVNPFTPLNGGLGGDTNAGGWANTYMRTSYMTEFETLLPSDLQAVVKTVTKLTANGGNQAGTRITATQDKLWLFSQAEVSKTITNTLAGEGRTYEYWSLNDNPESRIKNAPDYDWEFCSWSLRSPASDSDTDFVTVDFDGSWTNAPSTQTLIVFGCCI